MLLRKTKHARTRARLMKSIIFVERIKERLVSECSEILSPKPGGGSRGEEICNSLMKRFKTLKMHDSGCQGF